MGLMSDEERSVLEDWLQREMRREPIDLSGISDEQLDNYIHLVRLMKQELHNSLVNGGQLWWCYDTLGVA